MSRQTDYDRFFKACKRWQNTDNALAIYFKAPYTWMPRYIEEAVCDMQGYDYHPNPEKRELPPGFYTEALELVVAKDDRLRSAIIANVRREERERGETKNQLEFQFEELED